MAPSIAVLVINYNGAKYLEGCFGSLLKTAANEQADFFLVDNNSQDTSLEVMRTQFPGVSVIQTGGNPGFAGAYNFADNYLCKQGKRYDYYFFLNNDTKVEDPRLLGRLQAVLESHPQIGIVTPTILSNDGKVQYQGGDFWLWTGTTLGYHQGEPFKSADQLLRSKWATGCALFMRADLFRKVNRFEDYFMYQEDVSLSWKVILTGKLVATDCLSSLVHYGGGTEKSSNFEHYWAERNRLILYWQHFSVLGTLWTFVPLLVLRLLLLVRCRSWGELGAKLRGIVAGIAALGRFKKRSHSVQEDQILVRYLRTRIARYENSLPIS